MISFATRVTNLLGKAHTADQRYLDEHGERLFRPSDLHCVSQFSSVHSAGCS